MKLKSREVCKSSCGGEYRERSVQWSPGCIGFIVLEVVAACPSLFSVVILLWPAQLDSVVLGLVHGRLVECTTDTVHERSTMIVEAASLQSRVHSLADENIDTLAKDWGQNMDFRLDDVHPDSLETGSRIERLRKGSRWGLGSVPFDYHDDDDELCSG